MQAFQLGLIVPAQLAKHYLLRSLWAAMTNGSLLIKAGGDAGAARVASGMKSYFN